RSASVLPATRPSASSRRRSSSRASSGRRSSGAASTSPSATSPRPGRPGWTPRSKGPRGPDDAATVHDPGARPGARGPPRSARARPLARRAAGGGLALRHEPRLHAGAGRVLADEVRVARARGQAEPPPPVHRRGRRDRASLRPRAGRGRNAPAAPPLSRLAGLHRRVRAAPAMLTDPARFGGDPADAFTVVAPSLPGYGFSFRPNQPRFGVEEIADV